MQCTQTCVLGSVMVVNLLCGSNREFSAVYSYAMQVQILCKEILQHSFARNLGPWVRCPDNNSTAHDGVACIQDILEGSNTTREQQTLAPTCQVTNHTGKLTHKNHKSRMCDQAALLPSSSRGLVISRCDFCPSLSSLRAIAGAVYAKTSAQIKRILEICVMT